MFLGDSKAKITSATPMFRKVNETDQISTQLHPSKAKLVPVCGERKSCELDSTGESVNSENNNIFEFVTSVLSLFRMTIN